MLSNQNFTTVYMYSLNISVVFWNFLLSPGSWCSSNCPSKTITHEEGRAGPLTYCILASIYDSIISLRVGFENAY